MSPDLGGAADRTARCLVLAALVAAARTGEEVDVLTRIGLRAGFLWLCSVCGDPQFADRDTCCGESRLSASRAGLGPHLAP